MVAHRKTRFMQTEDGYPVSNFGTLLENLGTLALNDVTIAESGSFKMLMQANRLQARAFGLLGVHPSDFGLGTHNLDIPEM
jgi:hypothetical protein